MTATIPVIYSIDDVGGQATAADIRRFMNTTAPCRVRDCDKPAVCAIVTNQNCNGKNLCQDHKDVFLDSASPRTLFAMRAMGIMIRPRSVYDCPTNLRRYDLDDFGGFVTDAA